MTHSAPYEDADRHRFEVAGTDLAFRRLDLEDDTPTGRQVLAACGMSPHDQYVVLQWLHRGDLEEIRLEEQVRVEGERPARLIAARSDRTFRFMLNDRSMEWPEAVIGGAALRALGDVPAGETLFQRREDEPDRPLDAKAKLDLAERGTEEVYSRAVEWKLDVQGVVIVSPHPTIAVRDAMQKAGFDVAAAWIIVLKTAAERIQVELDYIIDLRLPGIEKLRLTPREINNGEAAFPRPRAFALLPADEAGLVARGLGWSTVVEQGRRWLLLHDVALPAGYDAVTAVVAMEIPLSYPAGEIDMFYVHPHLARRDGMAIPQTQIQQVIEARSFQRWSRHRGPSAPWRPALDNVLTHLALIDASLAREVGA